MRRPGTRSTLIPVTSLSPVENVPPILLLMLACLVVAYGLVLLGLKYKPLAWLLLGFLTWRRVTRRQGSTWSHGTARWSGWLDLRYAMLPEPSPVITTLLEIPVPPNWFDPKIASVGPLMSKMISVMSDSVSER